MLNPDTHIFLFALQGNLTPKETRVLSSKPWSISRFFLWEISKLVEFGRVELEPVSKAFLLFLDQVRFRLGLYRKVRHMNEFEFGTTPYNGLEVFDNPETSRLYSIEFTCPEWTALCPRSGFPDFGTILIRYEPRASCVELKSLKLYINSYRDVRIFHEGAVNQILTDLVRVCQPWSMLVEGNFNVRGNIKTIISAKHRAPDYPHSPTGDTLASSL